MNATVVLAVDLLFKLLQNSNQVAILLRSVRASGRESISVAELEQFVQMDDQARERQLAALDAADAPESPES
jgi:hypothetical protein